MIIFMSRNEILTILKDKLSGKNDYSYAELERVTGYSKWQLIRLTKEIEEKDIDNVMIRANTCRPPVITASDQEISYIVNFKSQYPKITTSK